MVRPKGSHSRQQRKVRPVSGRIRSWRSDSLTMPGGTGGPSVEAERFFPSAGNGEGAGYDLARHAALVRALAREVPGRKPPGKTQPGKTQPGKEKAPRE